jgi:outer membrane protein assembly factor BamD (BamD/ComL family)
MTADSDNSDVEQTFQAAQNAFDRGNYREATAGFEQTLALVTPSSILGGEVQMWLVTVYQAKGQMNDAIALCKKLTHHPDLKTRKEAKRVLYILEAPKLKSRPEWLTQIPDLTGLSDSETRDYKTKGTAKISTKPLASKPRPLFIVEPIDPSQVNTKDNQFVWVALIAVLIILGSVVWMGWSA